MNRRWRPARRLLGPLAVLTLTVVAGTIGYLLIEGWSVGDALFMVVISITTVGYGEVHPLSAAGRWFTSGLILVGFGGISYALSVIVGMAVDANLSRHWERRRMERRMERLTDHYIVCGYGRVGRQIAEELQRDRQTIVVLDVLESSLERAANAGHLVVFGNATEDDVLRRGGIDRARGLITAVDSDADNIFVTLSARALCPDLPIVARANHDDAVPKLRRAGATQVVSPYAMAGLQMARLALRPSTVDFVETLFRGAEGDLLVEDVRVEAGAPLVGVPLADARQRFAEGVTLLAVQREDRMLAPPPGDLVLQRGDVIAAVGREAPLRALEQACAGPAL
jgi:voltage-gated potassium channel